MKTSHLYIDELGSPNPHSPGHKYFVMTACVVGDSLRREARLYADRIKFKYWGRQPDYTDINFHSMEIGRRSGPFSILKNQDSLYEDFINDLFRLLKPGGMNLFVNVTDLAKAKDKNWDTKAVLKASTDHTIKSFVCYLLGSQSNGKVVIESATDEQNAYFLRAFSFYLSPYAIKAVDYKDVQRLLTSLSFVTKRNKDIEEQVADLFAYAARCLYERDYCGVIFNPASYESRIVTILEAQLFKTPVGANASRKKFYNMIEPYKILTK